MNEHAAELVPILGTTILLLLGGMGGLLKWAVAQFKETSESQTKSQTEALTKRLDIMTDRLGQQDAQLGAIRDLLADEVFKLREMIHAIDKRVLTIEGHCSLFHGRGAPASRADYDPAPVHWRPPE